MCCYECTVNGSRPASRIHCTLGLEIAWSASSHGHGVNLFQFSGLAHYLLYLPIGIGKHSCVVASLINLRIVLFGT